MEILNNVMMLFGGASTIGGVLLFVSLVVVKKVKWKKLAVKAGDLIYDTAYHKIDNTKYEGPVVTLINFLEMTWEQIKLRDGEKNDK